ncbi:MAG: hypothetical protein FWG68_10910 [Defluviitaleaceae bacterium]|nr:hypothetical protein [Defluviitaleaceae bacterium]
MIYCDKCSRMLDSDVEVCPICGEKDTSWLGESQNFQQDFGQEFQQEFQQDFPQNLAVDDFVISQELATTKMPETAEQSGKSAQSDKSETILRNKLSNNVFDQLTSLNQHIETSQQAKKSQPFHEFQQAKQAHQAQQAKYATPSEHEKYTRQYNQQTQQTQQMQQTQNNNQPQQPQFSEESPKYIPGTFMYFAMILLSVGFAFVGFIVSLIFMLSPNVHLKRLGKTMLVVSVAAFLFVLVVTLLAVMINPI